MKRMNICFFSGDITRSGGTERVAILIANELCKDEKYQISFVSLTERRETPFFRIDESISHDKLFDEYRGGLKNLPVYIKRLKWFVKEQKIDILIDIDGVIDMYSVPVRMMTKVKVISWEHFNMYYHPAGKMRSIIRKVAVKFLDAIVTLTEQDKEYYQQELKFKCPIVAIYNPVIYTGIDNTYDKTSKTIISVGRLTEQKGFDKLIPIAKKVLYKHKDWQWVILGEGEDREQLEQEIRENGLKNRLILQGNVENIDDWYRKSAMFVMTSRYEGLPMTLLEAKYYQLPIISYDIKTGPRECIVDGVNGYLVKEDDADTMEAKINKLIEDDDQRINHAKHALDDTEKFNLNKIVKQWKKLLDEIK